MGQSAWSGITGECRSGVMKAIRTRGIACTVALSIGLSACGGTSTGRSDGSDSLPTALTIYRVVTPPLPAPHYRTTGTYPQVSGGKVSLKAVNATLRQAVLDEERRYARFARKEVSSTPKRLLRKYPGIFMTSPRSRLISASSVVVSALIPTLELYPLGNDGAVWISVTVRVPSGTRVAVGELFADPARGLRELARLVRTKVLSTNSCVRQSFQDPIGFEEWERGFAPTASNYRHFALTTRGLVIGFPIAQVASPRCGRVEATVSYEALGSFQSKLGQRLIAGVRRPQR